MSKELLEKGMDVRNTPKKSNYQKYQDLGGIINEKDYDNALERAWHMTMQGVNETLIKQVEVMSKFAGIELDSAKNAINPRVILYSILRSDVRPKGIRHHHSQMSDQRIFVEALRMLGDTESVNKMIKAHPNISFKYQRETDK